MVVVYWKIVEVVTGEENEERVHSVRPTYGDALMGGRWSSPTHDTTRPMVQVRAKLLKLEPESQAWKERGSGQLHLNVAKDRSYARLGTRRRAPRPPPPQERTPCAAHSPIH